MMNKVVNFRFSNKMNVSIPYILFDRGEKKIEGVENKFARVKMFGMLFETYESFNQFISELEADNADKNYLTTDFEPYIVK